MLSKVTKVTITNVRIGQQQKRETTDTIAYEKCTWNISSWIYSFNLCSIPRLVCRRHLSSFVRHLGRSIPSTYWLSSFQRRYHRYEAIKWQSKRSPQKYLYRLKSISDRIITSMAVLIVCIFTAMGSQMPNLCISTNCPLSPSIPQANWSACWWCLARSVVNCLTTLPPQFWINVRGIISNARLTALYGYFSTPLKKSSFVWPSPVLIASSALEEEKQWGFRLFCVQLPR